jgi:hypothetical protein
MPNQKMMHVLFNKKLKNININIKEKKNKFFGAVRLAIGGGPRLARRGD